MRTPKVSIVIPVYNAEKYLKRCLDSVLSQTYDHDKIEVICVDDGSQDKSPKILKNYQKRYSDMIVLSQSNQGASAARNAGLEKATGEFVTFVDSDDAVKPDFVERLVCAMGGGDIVFSGHESRSYDGSLAYQAHPDPQSNWAPYKFIQVHGEMCRRSFLVKHKIKFPEKYRLDEDTFFTFNALAYTDKIKVTDYIGYIAYLNPTSVTHRINTTSQNRNTKVLQSIIKNLKLTFHG